MSFLSYKIQMRLGMHDIAEYENDNIISLT